MFKKKQTVDSIMDSFVQTKADLLGLLSSQAKQLDDIAIKQKELNDEKTEVTQEMVKAQAALGKINNFLGA